MRSIYNRTVAISQSSSNTSTTANQKSKTEETKEGSKNANNSTETTMYKKIRGVAVEPYFSKEEEKESYKMLS